LNNKDDQLSESSDTDMRIESSDRDMRIESSDRDIRIKPEAQLKKQRPAFLHKDISPEGEIEEINTILEYSDCPNNVLDVLKRYRSRLEEENVSYKYKSILLHMTNKNYINLFFRFVCTNELFMERSSTGIHSHTLFGDIALMIMRSPSMSWRTIRLRPN
jgi:hypothetical protein